MQKFIQLKGELGKLIIIVGVFNLPLSVISRTRRHKIDKGIKELSSMINQLDLNNI